MAFNFDAFTDAKINEVVPIEATKIKEMYIEFKSCLETTVTCFMRISRERFLKFLFFF